MVSSLQKNPGPGPTYFPGVWCGLFPAFHLNSPFPCTFKGFNSFQRPAGPSVTSTLHRWGTSLKINGWNPKMEVWGYSLRINHHLGWPCYNYAITGPGFMNLLWIHTGKLTFWTQKWRWMEDDFPFSNRWFSGSMLIFQGVPCTWFGSSHDL